MTDAALDLGQRAGLPDALRILLESYPREAWEADPGFSQLIRFWLGRHQMFRQLLERLQADAEAALDGRTDAQGYARALSRFGGMFVNELHGHHSIEDHHYFPALSRKDARLEGGFALLDADHHALDGHLNAFAERANAVLRADPLAWHGATGRFREGLVAFAPMLNRHLVDEEDLIVPVLLKYGEAGLG